MPSTPANLPLPLPCHGASPALQRKLFGAALAPAQMAGLVPAVVEVMQRYLAQWEAKGQVHIFQEVGRRAGWVAQCVCCAWVS